MATKRENQAQLATWIDMEAMHYLRELRETTGLTIGELVTAAVLAYAPRNCTPQPDVLASMEQRLAALEQRLDNSLDKTSQRLDSGKTLTRLTDEEQQTILALHQQGISMREISKRTGRDRDTVSNFIRKSKG